MTVTAGPSGRWQLIHLDDLLWVRFEVGAAIFHRRSGKTHFLNASSVDLLDQLSSSAMDVLAAAACLAGNDGGDVPPEFVTEISATLQRFERAGLIQRIGA